MCKHQTFPDVAMRVFLIIQGKIQQDRNNLVVKTLPNTCDALGLILHTK